MTTLTYRYISVRFQGCILPFKVVENIFTFRSRTHFFNLKSIHLIYCADLFYIFRHMATGKQCSFEGQMLFQMFQKLWNKSFVSHLNQKVLPCSETMITAIQNVSFSFILFWIASNSTTELKTNYVLLYCMQWFVHFKFENSKFTKFKTR